MECSWNDGGKTKYYLVIFDQLQGHSEVMCEGSPYNYEQWVVCRFPSYNQVVWSWSKLYYIEYWVELLYPVWQF